MTNSWGLCFLFISVFSVTGIGQQRANVGVSQSEELRLDESKPYVYLEVDRIGTRKPLRSGEPDEGLWLRFKNNSKTPLVVLGFASEANSSDAIEGLEDEVISNPSVSGNERAGSGIGLKPGQEQLTDIFTFPNLHEAELREAENEKTNTGRPDASRPHGYNGGYQPGLQVLKVIPPGGTVPFSVPINHVSKTWHLEIPFRFAEKSHGKIRQPYSYVAFFWEDLPEGYRADRSGSAPPKAKTKTIR